MKCAVENCINQRFAKRRTDYCRTHLARLERTGSVQPKKLIRTHVTGLRETAEYWAWVSMRARCNNQNDRGYKNYGGRGIKICDRWSDKIQFLKDMGPKPTSKHSLERINVNGDYEPGNCVWADRTQQSRNRRNVISHADAAEVKTLIEFGLSRIVVADAYNMSSGTIEAIIAGQHWTCK